MAALLLALPFAAAGKDAFFLDAVHPATSRIVCIFSSSPTSEPASERQAQLGKRAELAFLCATGQVALRSLV